MTYQHGLLLAVVGLVSLVLGCAAQPKQKPRILSSISPGGAPQAPPLDARQPIEVPTAPVQPRVSVVTPAVPQAVIVPPAPGAPLPVPGLAAPGTLQALPTLAPNGVLPTAPVPQNEQPAPPNGSGPLSYPAPPTAPSSGTNS